VISGGQKARVSLARAVYSTAQTILLDDILAALDVHTAVWIVTKCLKGDLLGGRTVLLVVWYSCSAMEQWANHELQTHNVAVTSPIAEYIVSIGTDGRILSQGKPVASVIVDQGLVEELAHEEAAIDLKVDLEERDEEVQAIAKGSKLVVAEEIQEGHVSWRSIALMATNLSSWPLLWWCGYLLGCIADEAAEVFEICM
jgi:ABC-type multidrug transport system ATPase subunit